MANVKEVKGTRHVDYLVGGGRSLLIGELENFLSGWQELGQSSPGGPRASIRAHVVGGAPVNLVLLLAPLKMVLAQQQHPPHQVGRGDALGTLALLVAAGSLHYVIGVRTVSGQGDVITVNTEVAVISTVQN